MPNALVAPIAVPDPALSQRPTSVPWQAWSVLRAIRALEHELDVDITIAPVEVQVTRLARDLKASKHNVIIGLDWLIEHGLAAEHGRTAFGARMITVPADACLCGATH